MPYQERFFTTTCAGTTTRAAPVTSACTTGARVATASSSRCSSPHATGPTLSGAGVGHAHGPAKRPGVLITNGFVQADEQIYWYAAQALAKAGYVVLTFDPRGRVHERGALVRLLGDACASALGPTVHDTAPLPVSPGALRSRGVRVHPAISNRACVEHGIEQHVLMRPSRPMR